MSGIVGIILVVASVLLFAWAVLTFRDPAGPAWREKFMALELTSCAIVAALVFGVALQVYFATRFEGALAWALTIGAFASLPAIFFVVWRAMGVRAKVAQYDAAATKPTSAPSDRLARKRA